MPWLLGVMLDVPPGILTYSILIFKLSTSKMQRFFPQTLTFGVRAKVKVNFLVLRAYMGREDIRANID